MASDAGYTRYFWTSRRSTPPAKCAGCSSRNIVPIRQRKRTIGCLGMIGLVLLIALVLLIFIAMSGPHGSGRDNYVNGYNRANGTHVNGYWRR